MGAWCPQCGPRTYVDEEGCCPQCGADAMGKGADCAIEALAIVQACADMPCIWSQTKARDCGECPPCRASAHGERLTLEKASK